MRVRTNQNLLFLIFCVLSCLQFQDWVWAQSKPGERRPGTTGQLHTQTAVTFDTSRSLSMIVKKFGHISLSVDGMGTFLTSTGDIDSTGMIQVKKPPNATLVGAYMAAASTGFLRHEIPDSAIIIESVAVGSLDTRINHPVVWDKTKTITSSIGSYNHWSDLTDALKPIINDWSNPLDTLTFEFTIKELDPFRIEGEILVMLFEDPTQTTNNNIQLFFGAQNVLGDSFEIELETPLNANARVEMGLGVSHSFQDDEFDQFSTIFVNGETLTTFAGGQDDTNRPIPTDNGALLTVGGLGDSSENPDLDSTPGDSAFRIDDELYELTALTNSTGDSAVSPGDKLITINTINKSKDDNIFFASVVVTSPKEMISMEPAESTNFIGNVDTVKATVTDVLGQPVKLRDVFFQVISGPHQNSTGTVKTDNQGQALFTYAGQKVGVDRLIASFVDSKTDTIASKAVITEWAFDCTIDLISPKSDTTISYDTDSLAVRAVTEPICGIAPIVRTCLINGDTVLVDTISATDPKSAAISALLPIKVGANTVLIECIYEDSLKNTATCSTTIEITRPCKVEITTPTQGDTLCAKDINVSGNILPEIDSSSFEIGCVVNGETAEIIGSTFMASVPFSEMLTATCVITDGADKISMCSDTIKIAQPPGPVCTTEIISPKDGVSVCGDRIQVAVVTAITGGTASFKVECEINGVMADAVQDTFYATVSLKPGENPILVFCTVTDSCGADTVCIDSIRVFRPAPDCAVTITSPGDGGVVCEDSLDVSASFSLSGTTSFIKECDINGIEPGFMKSMFMATILLDGGENDIIASCTVEDSCGTEFVCRDTIHVFLDDEEPTCEFQSDDGGVTGTFFDEHSGIGEIIEVEIRNGVLSFDAFEPGAKQVDFRIDILDPTRNMSFSIDVADTCGNSFNCDPVFLSLTANSGLFQQVFTFPIADKYFELNNHGLSEIRVNLNGNRFNLFSDPIRVRNEFNAYLMPDEGKITIDLQPYLNPEINEMVITYNGIAGMSAEILISGEAHQIDYVLDLQTVPTEFRLAQNYPNPFNPTTTIRFDIPQEMSNGVRTKLRIFNLLGELVRELVDEQKFPGEYRVEWDAKDKYGESVSSGIYIYQLVAGDFKQTRRLLFLK